MDDDFGKMRDRAVSSGQSANKPSITTDKVTTNTMESSVSDKTESKSKDTPSPTVVTKETEQVKLPQRFVVKYLGYRQTNNLWGIKYTRNPVDQMVTEAKTKLSNDREYSLSLLKMEVNEDGVTLGPMPQNNNPDCPSGKFLIESISYGVQDLVYTRVFAMIVVKAPVATDDGASGAKIRLSSIGKSVNPGDPPPFQCHAFVCDSRQTARRLTYALANAFHRFSKQVAAGKLSFPKAKQFAIDLRPPQDIEADLLDSEA